MVSKRQNIDFGVVAALTLLIVGIWCNVLVLYRVCVIVLLATALIPAIYTPFTWLWFKLAHVAELVFSKILLSVVFFLLVTPVGLLRKWFANDNMQLKSFGKENKSAFTKKERAYDKASLENQF